MKYVMIRYRRGVTQRRWHTRKWFTIYHVDQARDRYSIAEAGSVAEEKERKEGNQTIFFTNDDADEVEATTDIKKPNKGEWSYFIEDLNKMQSTEFTCPRRRNEFWQTASTPSLRTSLCWKNAS